MLLFVLHKPIAWLITSILLFVFDKALGNNIIFLGAVVMAMGAIGLALKRVAQGTRSMYLRISALADLAEHELNHNSGSSLKDHAKQAAEMAGQALDQVKTLNTQFESYVLQNSREKEQMWSAIEAVAHSTPPGHAAVTVQATTANVAD